MGNGLIIVAPAVFGTPATMDAKALASNVRVPAVNVAVCEIRASVSSVVPIPDVRNLF
jgi:hypothetical protein